MRRYHLIVIAFALVVIAYFSIFSIPARASRLFGPPSARLTISQRIQYSALLLSHGNELTAPLLSFGLEQPFTVEEAETVPSVASRLEANGLISNANVFRDYLIYTGLDVTLQAGTYKLSPAMSIVDIAREMQDATPEDVTFTILSGWRMEEIAASLSTSGLDIAPDAFLSTAQTPPTVLDFVPADASMEGFFYPDSYILPRSSTVDELLQLVARNFVLHITDEMRDGFSSQGLDLYQAVTLASLVEREAVHAEEQPLIASVFINRLNAGMQLGSDPTVQYALGYDPFQQSWWTNPLGLEDLQFSSPYNTYINRGLPPGPIANPGLSALLAVAFPQESPYYYFRAQCNDAGYHIFAVTFEEHLANACP
jgi:UPF0755 protein